MGQTWKYVYACKFRAVCPMLKNQVSSDSLGEAEFNDAHWCSFLLYYIFCHIVFSEKVFFFNSQATHFVSSLPNLAQMMDFCFLKAFVRHSQSKTAAKLAKQEVSSYFSNASMYGHQNVYMDSGPHFEEAPTIWSLGGAAIRKKVFREITGNVLCFKKIYHSYVCQYSTVNGTVYFTRLSTWRTATAVYNSVSQPFLSCVPPEPICHTMSTPMLMILKKYNVTQVIIKCFHVPPAVCLRTPRGTRTPWESLVYRVETHPFRVLWAWLGWLTVVDAPFQQYALSINKRSLMINHDLI